jgi:hypothetical protein
VPRPTQGAAGVRPVSRTRLSRAAGGLSRPFRSPAFFPCRGPTTPPGPGPGRFGLFPVRSPLLGESLRCFLFLRVLRCFSSPRRPPVRPGGTASPCRVAPFGHPRIIGRLRLPAAFRSLPRPSSPDRAKASAMRPNFVSPAAPRAFRRPAGELRLSRSRLFRFLPPASPRAGLACLLVLPVSKCQRSRGPPEGPLVENNGFEPLTPCLQSRCSSQLS